MVPFRRFFEAMARRWITSLRPKDTRYGPPWTVSALFLFGAARGPCGENGVEKVVTLETPPVAVDSRTLVPVRFMAETLASA
jgi:hypothetical protein